MRGTWPAALAVITLGCGGDDGGEPLPTGPLELTVPFGGGVEIPLTAGVPVRQGLFVDLPSDFELGSVEQITVDVTTTLANATLMRTDGGSTGSPTLAIDVRVQAGDATTSNCSGGAVAGAVTVTGNGGFTNRTASTPEITVPADALAILSGGSFSVCTTIESSVDATAALGGAAAQFAFGATCTAPPKAIAGVYQGTYTCNNFCGGPSTESGDIELTILQSGKTAAYIDDGGAVYFGSVCGGAFRHLGGKDMYWEYGVISVDGSSATKHSVWVSTLNPACGGTCDDVLTLK